MEILLWLAFPALATTVAMCWAAWVGRQRRRGDAADPAALARFAAAVQRPHPARGERVPPAPVEPASGVAVRRGQQESAPRGRQRPMGGVRG